jgi:hypothetical protein
MIALQTVRSHAPLLAFNILARVETINSGKNHEWKDMRPNPEPI